MTFVSYLELYISDAFNYLGGRRGEAEATNVVIGVPFDSTSSFRVGARYAPERIREASQYIETYSYRAGMDFDDVDYYDAGNIATVPNVMTTLTRVERVVAELAHQEKRPIILGGEHTITLGAIKGLIKFHPDLKVIIFDAHFDLRDEYPEGQKISHATVTRRLIDDIGSERVLLVGVRAFSRYELEVANSSDIRYFTSCYLNKSKYDEIIKELKNFISTSKCYISLDLDVIDPSYAPAVQNPEIEGLHPTMVLDILHALCKDEKLVGFDIVEFTPLFDYSGTTSVLAAKIVCEVLTYTFARD